MKKVVGLFAPTTFFFDCRGGYYPPDKRLRKIKNKAQTKLPFSFAYLFFFVKEK